MSNVKWRCPEDEEDFDIHASNEVEWTICGLAFEGQKRGIRQEFVVTKEKITCGKCIEIIKFCKSIKQNEIKQS